MKRILSFTALLLVCIMLLCLVSCNAIGNSGNNPADGSGSGTTESPDTNNTTNNDTSNGDTVAKTGLWANAKYLKDMEFGEGSKTVEVEVKVGDDSITFTLHTDKDTLGDALIEHQLISGEEGAYGLYVKYVNGIHADYDTDRSYWAVYSNGEYMMSGVDSTHINGGEHYELVYTK